MWAGWQAWRDGPEARTKIARGAKSRPPGPRPGMDLDDLRHRIRWGNVGRAGALLAVVALVVLWPQLRSEPPALPEARAVPAAPPATRTKPAPEPAPRPPAAAHASRRRHPPRPPPPAGATRTSTGASTSTGAGRPPPPPGRPRRLLHVDQSPAGPRRPRPPPTNSDPARSATIRPRARPTRPSCGC